MKILGIDPGTTRIGYGLIDSALPTALDYGLLDIKSKTPNQKTLELAANFKKLLIKLSPDIVAVEKLFFSKNQKTALDVSESRGIIKYIILERGLPLLEYGPGEVKLAVTNDGISDKKSVAKMVCRILKLDKVDGPDDITDALAIAITAGSRYKLDMLNSS